MSDKFEIMAPAKINLFLRVLGKRPDGYHDIYSWFQAIDLCDRLLFERAENPGYRLALAGNPGLPCDDSNLVIRAARLIFERYGLPGGLEIKLEKNIPVAAGLGGGSSDAAATIRALEKIFDLRLTAVERRALGLEIGSDVPFFFSTGQAEVTGRGELIKDIDLPQDYVVVLISPPLAISTAASYAGLKMDLTRPDREFKLSGCINFEELIRRIGDIGNDFETIHVMSYPVLEKAMDVLHRIGARLTRMSGSGPTVFGLFEETPKKEDLDRLIRGDWQVFVTRPITLPA